MNYRRARAKGATYFFTVVTHQRRPFLRDPDNVELLRKVFREVMARHPFFIEAMVVLPDHLHSLWTLPEGDNDFSRRWRLLKGGFSRQCAPACRGTVGPSRRDKQEQAVWQRRFWERRIRDERDCAAHVDYVDYIHYNPVRHGLADAVGEWPHSSFHCHVAEGKCPADWGVGREMVLPESVGHE